MTNSNNSFLITVHVATQRRLVAYVISDVVDDQPGLWRVAEAIVSPSYLVVVVFVAVFRFGHRGKPLFSELYKKNIILMKKFRKAIL